ncbi:uncharacterized protein LOC124805273 isoform X1 [Schistocerca piceifrons]|uniref:uncharacterized protein LOC124805273 isoform X1 n=1 Tax=Schistocerca piceifrons TaxID=274613 RepID=UPI001F5E9D78|nr:uncharacterized protein LOC124805273 isoform X1 [Schistocerca piceifrons]
MPVMYSFCFWFSVRLGSIIVGAVSLVQALVVLGLAGDGYNHPQRVRDRFSHWLDTYKLRSLKNAVAAIRDDPESFLLSLIILYTAYALSCLGLIYGAYKCNLKLMYPFVALDLGRLVSMSVVFVMAMTVLKANVYNLGILIGCSVAGGFMLLYLFYLWFCTVSMCQVVRDLEHARAEESTLQLQKQPLSGPYSKYASTGIGIYGDSYGAFARPVY